MVLAHSYLKGENMSVKTSNAYGNITISNEAIAIVTGYIARDCYGVVDLVNQKLTDSFSGLNFISLGFSSKSIPYQTQACRNSPLKLR